MADLRPCALSTGVQEPIFQSSKRRWNQSRVLASRDLTKGDHHERSTLLQQLAQVSSDRYRTWPHELARTAGPRYQSRRHPQRCPRVGRSLSDCFQANLIDNSPADDAGVSVSGPPRGAERKISPLRLRLCTFRMTALQQSLFNVRREWYLGFHRSDAPPPAELRFQTAHSSSQGASVGTAALLLPAVVRFFSESLPHLLPRQAFSFSGPAASKSQIELRFLPALFGVERRKGDP